jgi:hypothetical protein
MKTNAHRIRKQQWSIQTDSPEQAFLLRKQMNEQWETVYLPAFEKAFDEISRPDEYVHIQKLNLSIRARNSSEHPEMVREEIYRQLSEQLSGIREQGNDHESKSIVIKPRERYWEEVFLNYLEKGNLPWNLSQVDQATLTAEFHVMLGKLSQKLISALDNSRNRYDFIFRLLQLSSPSYKLVLNAFEYHFDYDWGKEYLSMIGDILETKGPDNDYDRYSIAATLFEFGISHRQVEQFPVDAFEMSETVKSAIINHYHFFFDSHELNVSNVGIRPGSNLPEVDKIRSKRNGKSVEEHVDASVVNGDKDSRKTILADPDYSNGLFVGFAGLILVHPFIHPLFVNTRIIKDGDTSIPVENLPRALSLLHFLASGEDDLMEYNTVLIKILLGLDPEYSLPVSSGMIRKSHREEVDLLLGSVIKHWSALKSTSVDAFRESFMQRRGLLKFTGDQWSLVVEPKAYDMLLVQLPWSYSICKLPWMKNALFTEWQTL